jgi:hypothetical protein
LPAGTTVSPLRTSLPVRLIHSPGFGTLRTTTESPSTAQNSCITIASAPCGIGAPVKMRAALPGASGFPTSPAWIRCAMWSRVSGAGTSADRSA